MDMKETLKLSIEDILNLKEMQNTVVLSGFDQLDKKVNKINIIVDPDIKIWINSEDFLLSTSFFYKAMSIDEQINFIKLLIKENVSCLGVKFSPHFEQLEQKVLEFAEKEKFVIMKIDYNVSFTNIIASIYDALFVRQMDVINKITKVHDEAMDLLLEGGNIFDIINTLENETKSRVFVVDNYYDKYYHSNRKDSEVFIKSANTFSHNNRLGEISKGVLKTVSIGSTIYNRYVFPLRVKNEIYGYIISFIEDAYYINMSIQLIESVATVISLYFFNQLSLEEVEISYRSEFLENLFSEDQNRINKAIDRSIFFNMSKEGSYQVAQFIFDKDINENQQIFKHLHRIKSYISNFEQANVLAVVNNRINLLYKFDKHTQGNLIDKFSNKGNFEQNYQVVFGRKVNQLSDVNRSYQDCKKIANNPGILLDNYIVNYENLGVYRLLINEHISDEIVDFYNMNLKDLVDYDEKRGTNLVETLEAYFISNGNLRKMSEILFTHYNTILYRMERIETITNKKIDNEDDRFNLHTSLKILKLLSQHKDA
ncbi:MAG: PucR family transcriptional regulator [Clostridiales bacterium]|nr:PucR family transcriptional regulator [Clostridiales bacterium]